MATPSKQNYVNIHEHASGLGRACVDEICHNGGHAAVLDVNEETGAELERDLGGARVRFFVCDVLDTDSVAKAVEGAAQWAKETQKPLGGVIPAAGVSTPATILDRHGDPFDLGNFDFVINVNLRGTVDLVRRSVSHMARGASDGPDGEKGVVIMVASSAAFDGQKGQVSYSASKGAVAAMTLPMARDLARHGIRVVTIAPSLFESRMTSVMPEKVRKSLERAMEFPLRAGKPVEFAMLVRQAVENVMLNGTVIRLDGAMRMPTIIALNHNPPRRSLSLSLREVFVMAEFRVAVLDDYQGLAETRFAKLDASRYDVTYFRDTLLPYDHPDTPQSVKDELVQRLEPFGIICIPPPSPSHCIPLLSHTLCTMRERTPFPSDLIARLPNLKLLLTSGRRNAALDLSSFKARGIPVAGTSPSGAISANPNGADSTTEHTVSLILALARNVAADDAAIKHGGWQTGFATGLSGKTLGVVGLGRLGGTTARIMHLAFGMRVVAWSANLTQEAADERARELGLPAGTFRVVGREELFAAADVVSVHVVLSERTRGLIGAADLGRMKSSAFLVNTSRGPLVVEEDLLAALRGRSIAGVALDVFGVEPLPPNSPWRDPGWGEDGKTGRVLLTPHMGYVQEDNLGGWYEQQVANIERWASGRGLENVFQ
ncbi:Phosphoglycerate dehydrogenase or related dehydrogenase [Geosmithia morbida]|uniref:Phosphoglycerate dehydrogenase or related dehydrogenase n=1 Tax=Geosmithia morbida TaxID=1094350 RepID=A0A9P4Z046_9HYPO|nr:Phosphoglycerate dehydrogenase or related dehydrogenase [Geosmithia morbida]KAF4124974.1 Phosphoglycerate dehydrogenase or related dehydrogenase [Geosmithia morbida]